MGTHPAAPLDGGARVSTGLIWGVVALLWVASGSSAQAGRSGAAAAFAAAAAGIALLALVLRRAQPVSYRVEAGAVVIEGRRRSTRIDGEVGATVPVGASLRVIGSGGLYGYLGWFRADGLRARSFVTDRRRAVVVPVGAALLVISPLASLEARDA